MLASMSLHTHDALTNTQANTHTQNKVIFLSVTLDSQVHPAVPFIVGPCRHN